MALDKHLKIRLEKYIELNYIPDKECVFIKPDVNTEEILKSSGKKFEEHKQNLAALVDEVGETFHEMLFRVIQEKEAIGLLESAGYALSLGDKGDIIVKYFIENEIFDMDTINCALYEFGERPIGV